MERLIQDVRYAIRSLAGSPAFTIIAAITLALGIGANTAIFSVLNAVLLKPLPYADPGRLVTVNHFYPSLNSMSAPVSAPGFRDYSAKTELFSQAAVETGAAMNLTGSGDPERVNVSQVSANFFPVLGVRPLLGRTLRPDEAEEGRNKVVVLTYGFWKDKFAGDSAAVGRTLALNGETYEVVGVMPATFRDFFFRQGQMFTPLFFRPEQMGDGRRTNEYLNFVARLKDDVTLEQARASMAAYATSLRAGFPNSYSPTWTLTVTPLAASATANVRPALFVLVGAVAFVLLIACANVANLQLARTAARAREIAVRVALGASPGRLIRQLLTESVLLGMLGGTLGLALAIWGVPALMALNPRGLPPQTEVRVDALVLVFAFLVSIVTGLLFGFMPAIQVARDNLHETLKEGGRGAAGPRGSLALRRGLVVATMAMALTLLAGAGLLIRSFQRMTQVEPGFRPGHLLTFNINLPRAKYSNDTLRIAALEQLAAAIAATPGVVAAGGTSNIPFGGNWSTGSFNVEGYTPGENAPSPWGDVRAVSNGYLPAIQATLIEGRQFGPGDRLGAPRVAIVDQEMAKKYWPNASAIGKRLTFNDPANDSVVNWIEIVGVVSHTAHEGLDAQARTQLYLPIGQRALNFLGFTVRTSGDPLQSLAAVRAAVHSVDADLPVASPNTMDALIDQSTGPRRFAMLLLGIFAAVALILASIGLYGVMSFTVTQRSRELGVRVALGASTSEVLAMVLRQGVKLAVIGLGIGLVAALLLTRLMARMLFSVSATDPLTFAVISIVLIGVAVVACYVPAHRATKADPIVALRAE